MSLGEKTRGCSWAKAFMICPNAMDVASDPIRSSFSDPDQSGGEDKPLWS